MAERKTTTSEFFCDVCGVCLGAVLPKPTVLIEGRLSWTFDYSANARVVEHTCTTCAEAISGLFNYPVEPWRRKKPQGRTGPGAGQLGT